MKKGYHTYNEINTMGMSQLDLILTVYRGAINFLKQAQTAYREERPTDGRTFCERARRCIVHLYATLDMDKGEDIAARLGQLYAYMIEQLDVAVAQQSVSRLDDIIRNLDKIKEGWESLKEQEAAEDQQRRATPAQPSGTASDKAPSTGEKRVTISA